MFTSLATTATKRHISNSLPVRWSTKVWLFGPNTELLHSRQVVDPPSYVNYVEFNEAETHLLLSCMIKGDTGDQCLLAVMSIEKSKLIWFNDSLK